MAKLRSYRCEFGEIRVLKIDGEPWFVFKDIVTALGYSNGYVAKSCAYVCNKDIRRQVIPIGCRQMEVVLVDENGLKSLLGGSRKSRAKMLRAWLEENVLSSPERRTARVENDPVSEWRSSMQDALGVMEAEMWDLLERITNLRESTK